MGLKRSLTAVAAALLVTGCGSWASDSTAPWTQETTVHDEALRQRRLWRESGVQRYEVTWLLLEGGDDAVDRYRTARIVARSVLDTRCPNDRCPELHLRSLLTVDDAFELILNAPPDCTAAVQYHPTLPLPTWIRIDCADRPSASARVFLRAFTPE